MAASVSRPKPHWLGGRSVIPLLWSIRLGWLLNTTTASTITSPHAPLRLFAISNLRSQCSAIADGGLPLPHRRQPPRHAVALVRHRHLLDQDGAVLRGIETGGPAGVAVVAGAGQDGTCQFSRRRKVG